MAEYVIISAVAQGAVVAPASLVLRGSVQLVACIATQISTFHTEHLASIPVEDWRKLRSGLEQHRINRAFAIAIST